MAVPTLTCRIDWANKGTFDGPYDTVAPIGPPDGQPFKISRGASADFASDPSGQLTFDLDDVDHRYTPDRNWADGGSFETGTNSWGTYAIASLTAAATSITQVTDNAGQGGTKAGEAVLTSTVNSGVVRPLPYTFQSGVTYAFSFWLKSVSGNLNVRAGLASAGTPADIASTSSNITSSWAQYTGTWTPSGDRTDAVMFVRTTTASAATVRIDAINVNPGSTANAFIEAPTRGELVPGRPVHVYANYSSTDYPRFYGFIKRLTPNPQTQILSIVADDVLQRMADTDIVVPTLTAQRTARELRLAVLGDYERGNRNYIVNPSAETDTSGWTATTGGHLTRLTTDAAPGAGTCCFQYAATALEDMYQTLAGRVANFYAGETYRFSVYGRVTSGTQTWKIGLGTIPVTYKSITLTTAWQRFSVAWTVAEDAEAVNVYVLIETDVAQTARFDAVQVTRGEALYPYSDSGSGRWQNIALNESVEATTDGWYQAWANWVGNPSFETDTTGWAVTADSFHAAATSITRVTSGSHKYGSAHGEVTNSGTVVNQGCHYAVTGTFVAGTTYRLRLWAGSSAGGDVTAFIGSNGTPTDKATLSQGYVTGYQEWVIDWTPSANRTDVHVGVALDNAAVTTISIDGVSVMPQMDGTTYPTFCNTGPGAGTARPLTTFTRTTAQAKYGAASLNGVSPATSGCGVVYDFAKFGGFVFKSTITYGVSVWLRATSAMPYRAGIAVNLGDGTFNDTNTTGTLSSDTWTQISFDWTPSVDRTVATRFDIVFYVEQTNATSRTFYVDGLRIIPQSGTDSFELAQWAVPAAAESDVWQGTGQADMALAALEYINKRSLSRHWIRPTMTTPWYQYVVEDRDTFAVKASAATITDTQDWTTLDIDRDAVVNVVKVTWLDGQDIYSDPDSVAAFGPRFYSIYASPNFPDRTVPDIIGPALVRRYAWPRIRPQLRLEGQFTAQLARDLNDVVTVTVERFITRTSPFVILRADEEVSESAQSWTMTWQAEEFPY